MSKPKQAKAKAQAVALPNQLDTWVFYGLLAISVALPLAMSRITFDQFDIAKVLLLRIFTLVTVSLWVWKMVTTRKKELRWSKVDFAVIAFLLLVFISTITSVHVPTAIHGKYKRYEGLLTFLNYGILYFLALQAFTSFKRLSTLSKTITLTGGLVSLYGVIQFLGLDPLPWATLPFEQRRSFSTFGNPDLLGGFLVILMPLAVVEFLKARDAKNNILMGSILFISLLCLLTAFTRGAWLGSAVALVVLAVLGGKTILTDKKKLLLVLVAFVSIFAVVMAYSASTGHGVMNLVDRLKSTTQLTEGSAASRIEIWKAGLKMIESKPVFGLGPDTYRLGSERYETKAYVAQGSGQTVADNAHNWVVQLAAGVGIPATLILIGLFFTIMAIAIKYSRRLEGDDRLTYAALIGASIGYFIHLLFGVSISGSTGVFFLVISAILAVTPAVRSFELKPTEGMRFSLQASMVVVIVISAVSAYYALAMYVADYDYAAAIQLGNEGQIEAATSNYERSIELYKNGRYYDGYGMFLDRVGVMQQSRDMIAKSVSVYQAAQEYEPLEGDHYVFLASGHAKLATSSKDPMLDTAVAELQQAISVRPNAYSARILLSNVYMFQGKYQQAIDTLKFVLDINPQEKTAFQIMAKCYQQLGNKKEAQKYYKKYLVLQPDDPEAKAALQLLGKK